MSTPSGRLRSALITGGALRIGRAIAFELAAAGYGVAIHYRHSAAEAEALAAELAGKGIEALALPADLADPHDAARLVARHAERLAAPALIVNNASAFDYDDIATLTPSSWRRHIDVNLTAPVVMAQALARLLGEGERAAIVNIVDQRVLRPTPEFFSYGVSKAALWQTTRILAQALAPRIRVNAVAPGPVLANVHQSPEDFAREAASTLLGRGPDPQEIARAVVYLADATSVTGELLVVDGGQHLAFTPEPRREGGGHPAAAEGDAPAQPTAGPAITPPKRALRTVLLERMELMASVGVFEHEIRYEQRLLVSLRLEVVDRYAGRSDRIGDVYDYDKAIAAVRETVYAGHYNLIETVAERIAERCLSDPDVRRVVVRIEKPDVLASGRSVGIEVTRSA